MKARRQTAGCVGGMTLGTEGLGRQMGNGLATTEVTRARASDRESPKLCEEKRMTQTDFARLICAGSPQAAPGERLTARLLSSQQQKG